MKSYQSAGALFLVLIVALILSGCQKKTQEEILLEALQAKQRNDIYGVMVKTQEAIKKDPNTTVSLQARMLLGVTCVDNREFDKARKAFGEVVQIGGIDTPVGQSAYSSRIMSYIPEGKPEKAIEEIIATSPTLKSVPSFARQTQIYLSELYMQTRKFPEATSLISTLLANSTEEEEAWKLTNNMAAILINEKKYDAAIESYQAHLKKFPDSENKGLALYALGDLHRQIAKTAADARVAEANNALAKANTDGAVAYFTEKISAEKDLQKKAMYLGQLSKIYMAIGTAEVGEKLLADHLQGEKNEEQKMRLLGLLVDLQMQQDKIDSALALLKKEIAGKYQPANKVQMYVQVVGILNYAKRYDEAKQWITKIEKDFPGTEYAQRAPEFRAAVDQRILSEQQATTGTLTTTGTLPSSLQGATTESLSSSGDSLSTSTVGTK